MSVISSSSQDLLAARTRAQQRPIGVEVLHLYLKNVEKQGIQPDCAEMGKLPKQDEVNSGGEPRSQCLMQNKAACQPCRLSRYPRTRMQSIHTRQLLSPVLGSPPSRSSLHFTSGTDVKTFFSFQKEDKHGFQCRLKYTRTFETWLVITNSWLLSSKWRKTFPLVGLATKPRGKKKKSMTYTVH